MELDLLIKKDLDDGITWDTIVKKYKIGKSTIKKVKEQGRFYLDLDTKDIVLTSKAMTTEEQIFHYIMNETQADFTSSRVEWRA